MKSKNLLLDDVSDDFGRTFVSRYMLGGFGSMSKSEIDICVFHLLTKSVKTDRDEPLSNYAISNMLQIPESRVKYLRLHAALKYGTDSPKDILKRVFIRIEKFVQKPEFSSQDILISLEDPVEKREFENAVKLAGRHVQYNLNKELLTISPLALLEVIVHNFDDPDASFDAIIRKAVDDKKIQRRILSRTNDLRGRFNALADEFKGHSTTATLLIAGVSKYIAVLG